MDNEGLEKRVETLEIELAKLREGSSKQAVGIGKLEVLLETIVTTLKEVKQKVDKLSEAPGKRWDMLVNLALSAAVAGIIAGFFK